MWKSISLEKIDELHNEFHSLHIKGETFSEFIERINETPVWDWTDSVGIIKPEDFKSTFDINFIKENFEELSEIWFKGLNAQIDYSILLECVKDELATKYNEWKKQVEICKTHKTIGVVCACCEGKNK